MPSISSLEKATSVIQPSSGALKHIDANQIMMNKTKSSKFSGGGGAQATGEDASSSSENKEEKDAPGEGKLVPETDAASLKKSVSKGGRVFKKGNIIMKGGEAKRPKEPTQEEEKGSTAFKSDFMEKMAGSRESSKELLKTRELVEQLKREQANSAEEKRELREEYERLKADTQK